MAPETIVEQGLEPAIVLIIFTKALALIALADYVEERTRQMYEGFSRHEPRIAQASGDKQITKPAHSLYTR